MKGPDTDVVAAVTRAGGVILVEVTERVAVVTLNRPDARNALNRELLRAIWEVLPALDRSPDVDVVVLTGADPAFCAGLDLRELGGGNTDLARPRRSGALPDHHKPIIGAVNGPAVTGGLELALACDLLVASDRARFADTHARVGVMPGWGLTVLLPEAIGLRRAREMSLTGNFIDAIRAEAWGLVNQVVGHDELLPTALCLAADISSNDQAGVQQMLRTYADNARGTATEAWTHEAQVATDWARSHPPTDLDTRRDRVIARGRDQI